MNNKHFILISFCVFFFYFVYVNTFSMTGRTVRLDRIDGVCKNLEHVAITLENVSLIHRGRLVTFAGDIRVKRELKNQIELAMDIHRCLNKESLDTCEHFQTLKFPHCCEVLGVQGQFWTPFLDNIKPPMRCPIKAGIYTIQNGTFDISSAFIPPESFYWRMICNSFDAKTKEQVLCLKIDLEAIKFRRDIF